MKYLNCILPKSFFIAFIFLACNIVKANQARPISSWSQVFEPGVVYSYKAGTRGFGEGRMYFVREEEVLNFKAKIRFLGAGTFSRTSLNEVLTVSRTQILPEEFYFKNKMNSFSENQKIVKKIDALVKEIESRFESTHSRLELTIEYGNDSEYLNSEQVDEKNYALYLNNLRNSVDEKHGKLGTDAIPLSIVAKPEASRASPSEWDLYSHPRYFAHEFFHVIGLMFEGYECGIYPPIGIMQDGIMFAAIEKYGREMPSGKLLISDLLEIITSFGFSKSISPPPKDKKLLDELIQKYSSSSICRNSKQNYPDYLSWPVAKQMEVAKQSVLNWLKGGLDKSTFLIDSLNE